MISKFYSWKFAGIALLLVIGGVFGGLFQVLRVTSASMQPSICTGDFILVRRGLRSSDFDDLRGALILAKHGTGAPIVKRVIGQAGDEVIWQGESLIVNSQTQTEPYACRSQLSAASRQFVAKAVRISDSNIYVLGDNRDNSEDSRNYGPISLADVLGRVVSTFHSPESNGCTCSR